MLDFPALARTYQNALLRQVVPFWAKHSRDRAGGGFYDVLADDGSPIPAHKTVARQAELTWAFAWLYQHVEPHPDWFALAEHGAAFLVAHARDARGRTHATLDRSGWPTGLTTNLISDARLAMAFGQTARITGQLAYQDAARQSFQGAVAQREQARKARAEVGSYQRLCHLAEPVALLGAALELSGLVSDDSRAKAIEGVSFEILHEFMDKRAEVLREFVLPDGGFSPTPGGRRLNPGLTLEAIGYLFDHSVETGNRRLVGQLSAITLATVASGWDELAGGLCQYVDWQNQPVLTADAYEKTARTHAVALLTLLKAHRQTAQPDLLRWFKRIHEYTFQHFPDVKHGGWHATLDRQGRPLLTVKATPEHGCFHLIRSLAGLWQLLEKPADAVKAEPQKAPTVSRPLRMRGLAG